jgi:hypothetical protein
MTACVDNGPLVTNVHYVRMYRRISEEVKEWPQFMILYMDGNIRLAPFPPKSQPSVCFGSSVLVGPAPLSKTPIAEIKYVRFLSKLGAIRVVYADGSTALLEIGRVDRQLARLRVSVGYPTDVHPFAHFRSMYVEDGNCDSDRVKWLDYDGVPHGGVPMMTFERGEGLEWFFYRETRSKHNTSGPDIRIGIQALSPPTPNQ